MTNPLITATDWHVDWWSVTDGDTVRVRRWRDVQLVDTMRHRIYDDPVQLPHGLPVRVINLDTPERSDRDRWAAARADITSWLVAAGEDLMVTTWGTTGGFDRLLGDFWVSGDRSATATQHMLRDKDWPPYQPR